MNTVDSTHWAKAKMLRYTGILEAATPPMTLLAGVVCRTLKNNSPSMARSTAVSIRTVAT